MLEAISINAHSSIRIGGQTVLYVDPFRLTREAHDADLILFTHPHYDHFSPEDFARVARPDTVFVCPGSMRREALAAGIAGDRLVPIEAEETLCACGVEIEAVPAYNLDQDFHPREKGWLGYVLEIGRDLIYVAGDTDATGEAAAVECGVALLPIGGTYTMTAEQAAALANTMRPDVVIPTHYGSIVGSPEDAVRFRRLVDPGIEVCIKLG